MLLAFSILWYSNANQYNKHESWTGIFYGKAVKSVEGIKSHLS